MRILFFLLFLSPLTLFAQGPPITAQTPVMLGLSGGGIRTFGKFVSTEKAKIYIQPVAVPYNFLPTLQVGAILPFKFIASNNGDIRAGLADFTLFGKFELLRRDGKAKTFRILGVIKERFPTATDSSLGGDAFQTYAGLVVGNINARLGLYGDLGYVFTNKDLVGGIEYNLSIGLPLLKQQYPPDQINVFLESSGKYTIGTKAHSIFLSPGIQYIPGRRFLIEGSFQFPLLQNITPNPTYFSFLLGTRFLFN